MRLASFKQSARKKTHLHIFIIAKLSLNSTQSQLKLRLRLALFPADPPTHPHGTVGSKTSLGELLTVSRPLNHHFKTTLRKTMPRLYKDYLNTALRPSNPPLVTNSRLLEKLFKTMPWTP